MIPATVFEAANLVEAHMVQDLLRQQGLPARVEGEYLQGALGELPTRGLVRVVVDDELDAVAARRVIAEFEAAQPGDDPHAVAVGARSRGSSRIGWVCLGLVVGMLATVAALRTPAREDGLDHDRDGVADERWTHGATGRPLSMDADRNFDHRVDMVNHYDARGELVDGQADDDFDGRFETALRYRQGMVESSEVDADGDGYPELRFAFEHGVPQTMSVVNPSTGWPLRVEHYRFGLLTEAEVDTDRDGRLDTRLRYTPLAEVVAREPIVTTAGNRPGS
ncbi:MAG: DUF2007 domain-containing protein [Pseudomonadota bacterium]